MTMTTPSRQRRWRRRAAAVLYLTLAAAQRPAEGRDSGLPVNARFSVNAAVQPPTTTPSLDELLAMLNQSRIINGGAILNPFTRTRTPIFTAIPTPSTSSSSSPSSPSASALATSSPEVEAEEPSSATRYDEPHPAATETPVPASDTDTTDAEFYPTEDTVPPDERPSEGSSDAPAAPSSPQQNEEIWSESPTPSASRSPNSISFDVVKPQSHSSDGDQVDVASTTPPPPPPPPPTTTTTTTTETPVATATTQTPSVTPTEPMPTSTGSATGNATTTTTATQIPINETATTTKLPTAHNQDSGGVASSTPTVDKGILLLAETTRPGNPSGGGNSSSSGEQVANHRKKKKGAAGSGSGGGTESLESSNQSGGSRYSMGTASIMSIVGVIVGICVIVSLFVLISRRKYDNDDSDDDDVLCYGGHGGYGHGNGIKLALGRGSNSIVRLSPTFLMNDMAAPAPGQPMEPDLGSYSPRHNMMVMNSMSSTRGGLGAVPAETPMMTTMMVMGSYAQQPLYHHHHSISGGEQEGGPSPSAFDSTDDLSMLDSRSSDGWSSVLESESDFDHRAASRCTRDTTFSSINYTDSECNPADLRSGSGIIINRNTTAPRPPPSQHTFDLGIDEDQAAMSSYQSSHVRSSDGSSGLGQSLRSPGSS